MRRTELQSPCDLARFGAYVASSLGAIALVACTAFDGLEPSAGTGAGGVGGQGGGAGGGEQARSLLPLLDAANLCSLAFRCPSLGGSLLLSTGLPLVSSDAEGRATVWNYSSCIDWLTSPLEAGHMGFESLRDVVLFVAPATVCELASELLPVRLSDDPTLACEGRPDASCSEGGALRCPSGLSASCEGPMFAPGTTCLEAEGAACAVGSCAAPESSCDAGYFFECVDGLRRGHACGVYGLVCEPGTGCVGQAGPTSCTELGDQQCSGDGRRVRTCAGTLASAGPYASEIDCAAMGRRCELEAGTARCAPPEAACSPHDPDRNRCVGDTIELCVQGAPTALDCTLLGKRCEPASADGRQTAHCR